MTGPLPVVLDCDPGHDDAIALLLALGNPALELRAVTTVAGNGTLERVTENARRILTLAGALDIPLAAGAAGPLAGGPGLTAPGIHGESALDGPVLPEPAVPLDPRPAAELLAASADTLIATGPLTNVAQALDLGAAPREIVWMGGSTAARQPVALRRVQRRRRPRGRRARARERDPVHARGPQPHPPGARHRRGRGPRARVGGPVAEAVAGWLRFFADSYRTVFGFPRPARPRSRARWRG